MGDHRKCWAAMGALVIAAVAATIAATQGPPSAGPLERARLAGRQSADLDLAQGNACVLDDGDPRDMEGVVPIDATGLPIRFRVLEPPEYEQRMEYMLGYM